MPLEPLSTCSEQETLELFREGIKMSADRFRQLAGIRKDKTFLKIANLLMAVYTKGDKLIDAKSMSQTDTQNDIQRRLLKLNGKI